jgi:hypothetical protein
VGGDGAPVTPLTVAPSKTLSRYVGFKPQTPMARIAINTRVERCAELDDGDTMAPCLRDAPRIDPPEILRQARIN